MITFLIALLCLVGGYFIYGLYVERVFRSDYKRKTPALTCADGVDLHMEQKSITKRLLISIPLFLVAIVLLLYSLRDKDGFDIIWRYFAWCNQTLSVFTLWAVTVYLVRENKNYWITLLSALFMTAVCSTYICIAPEGFTLTENLSYGIGLTCTLAATVWFIIWYKKQSNIYEKVQEI